MRECNVTTTLTRTCKAMLLVTRLLQSACLQHCKKQGCIRKPDEPEDMWQCC